MKYLEGNKIRLDRFTDRSITPEYISWLKDHEVTRFLDTGRLPISAEEIYAPKDNQNFMFMVMANFYIDGKSEVVEDDFNNYIGTCSLHRIDWISRKCEVGYMVGNKRYWGHGVASELIKLLVEYGFDRLNMNKITAGVVGGNEGSIKALEKNGFYKYAIEPQDYYLEGSYLDTSKFCLLKDDYFKKNKG